MKKIIILLAMFSILVSLMLSGCAKAEKNENVTEIVFWQAMGGPLGDALAVLVDDFNDTHPDIFVNSINMGNYTALSQKLTASIQTGNQPDVAQAFEAWTAYLDDGDVLYPVQQFIDEDPNFGEEDLEDFYPVFISSNTMNGRLLSFPFNKSVQVLYYNKDILFQNNYNPHVPPKTWDEFRSMSKALTMDLDGDGKFDQFGQALKISAWKFENLLLQAGGEIMSEDGKKPLFNSKAGVEALDFITACLNEDKSSYLTAGYDGQADFTASKVAFYEDSSVSMAYMKRNGFDFMMGVAAIPSFRTKANIISGTNVIVFKSGESKREKAAWEFIKWFTDTAQTAKWSELTYYMPVRKSAFNEPGLKKRLDLNPEIADVYDQLNYATFEPQISEWFETRKYLEEHVIEKVIRGTLGAQEALDNAAVKIEKMINESDK